MNLDGLLVYDATQKRQYTAQQIIDVLDGTGAGSGNTARAEMTATYSTSSVTPTVYYTGLNTDGSILSARSTSGVTLANGLYQKTQATVAITDFIAVWDEGDPDVYESEWIVVDT